MEQGSSTGPPALSREAFAAGALELELVLVLVARHAPSSLGRRALRELEPRDDQEAPRALARVREMQHLLELGAEPSWAGITDPLAPFEDGAPRVLDEPHLVQIRSFARAARQLVLWFDQRAEELAECAAVAARIPDTDELADRIDLVLDERGKVRPDATPALARMRREASRLSERIDGVMRELLRKTDVRNVLSDGSVHRRGGRPVLAVKAKSSGRVKGIVHDRSQSENTVFVEPRAVIEPGNRLAEVLADERREVERVLLELTRHVVETADVLGRAAREVSELELAWIGAQYARAEGARTALLPGEPGAADGLLLRSARHPLLLDGLREGRLDEVVPVDVRLQPEFDMLIVTGPNTGGKTLALKTVGIFGLLTRLGLPVPCTQGTTVPLYDGICADIGDEQEISQNLSTFASHLVRVRSALELATDRTLVLLDELGGGTDPEEGAALGEAVLETLLARSAPTLVTTHIGRLKEFAWSKERVENACTEFDLETLAPRYKLHVGTPGESGALVIARRLGLDEAVIRLAESRVDRPEGELAELMDDVRHARLSAEKVRSEADDRLEDAQRVALEATQRKQEIERKGELLEAEAQKGLEERVRDAARRLERARVLLHQLPKSARDELEQELDALGAELSGAALTDRRRVFIDGLGKGSLVYVPRYRQRCLVHKVDRVKREVVVKLGSMKMRVSFDEVTTYEAL